MATESKPGSVKTENLLKTKKYETYVKSGDLYALPVTAVPGCGFILGVLLKRQGITRANQLYDVYAQQRKSFSKYLACKFGPWNVVYANAIIRAFEDWEKIHVVKPERKTKAKVVQEKKKGPPRKVGPGSKKWEDFLKKADLAKTSVTCVPGVASILGEEMKKRGFCTAKQLMDQYKGDKKGQCNGDDEKFHKWILCCFGYWNTQYSKAVLAALKAYGGAVPVTPKQDTEGNENQAETLLEKVVRFAEETAEKVSDALEVKQENEENEETEEGNENQAEMFLEKVERVAEETAEKVSDALEVKQENEENEETEEGGEE